MGELNYLEGIENIQKMSYEAFVNRQAALRGISSSDMEKLIETETIMREFNAHGYGEYYGIRLAGSVDHPVKHLSDQYDAITDFSITRFSNTLLFSFLCGANKILVQGTGIRFKDSGEE